jgi:hypothetical protein
MPKALNYTCAPHNPQEPTLSRGLKHLGPLQKSLGSTLLPNGTQLTTWDLEKLNGIWLQLQAGDFEPRVGCWLGWLGVQDVLDSWRSDYGIWQAQDLASNAGTLASWCFKILKNKLAQRRDVPCTVIPNWVEDQVWVSLLPAPGFGMGTYPAVVDFGTPLPTKGKRLRGSEEVLVLNADLEHPILWAPVEPSARLSLLRQAHLQGAVFQIL